MTQLIEHATETRPRAERRLDEMMKAQPKAKVDRPLKDIGVSETPISESQSPSTKQAVDKNLAKRARKTAALAKVKRGG